jgi:hypothetical protein
MAMETNADMREASDVGLCTWPRDNLKPGARPRLCPKDSQVVL